MKKPFLYFLAALLSFVFFIVLLAPAAPIWSLFYASYGKEVFRRIPELTLSSLEGTIWEGQTDIHYRTFPTSHLQWQISPTDLLQKTVEAKLNVNGDAHNFEANLVAQNGNFNIKNLHGTVDAKYINQVSENLGVTFSGAINVENISISGTHNKLDLVEGTIKWSGGEVVSRTTTAGTQTFDLPPLKGEFSVNEQNGGIQLDIHQDRQVLIAINVRLDGWVEVDIKYGLFALAGLSWQGDNAIDVGDSAIIYEEKIF